MKEQLFVTLENSRGYTVAVAEAMPDDSYNFKPAGGGWNFLELMHHIAYGIFWWNENYIKGKEVPWEQPATKTNKKEVINYLAAAYNAVKDTLEKQ
ncbi:MAG TPA: DinB family protein, partial [Flavitalea sp.]|nr:DinB family protein [Flavitalea sp.]